MQKSITRRCWSSEPCLSLVRQLHMLISYKMKKQRKSGRDLRLALRALSEEPGQVPPKMHRGKAMQCQTGVHSLLLQGSSPAEELLMSTLDFWATALQHLGRKRQSLGNGRQCRREVEDEGRQSHFRTRDCIVGQFQFHKRSCKVTWSRLTMSSVHSQEPWCPALG